MLSNPQAMSSTASKKVKKTGSYSGWWPRYKYSVWIALSTFLIYANSIGNGYNMDDELVTRNHRLTSKGVSAIPDIFTSFYYEDAMNYKYEYRPVVLTTFAIENSLFGESPKVGHFINLLLYAISCLLLLNLLQQLFKQYNPLLAVGATLLFVAHPLHTEVVCSLKNRDEILALLFSLLSLKYAWRFMLNQRLLSWILSGAFFTIALMAKQSALIFLAVSPLILIPQSNKLRNLIVVFIGLIVPMAVIDCFTNQLQPVYYAVVYVALPLFVAAVHWLYWSELKFNNKWDITSAISNWLAKKYAIVSINGGFMELLVRILELAGWIGLILLFLFFSLPVNGFALIYLFLLFFLIKPRINVEWLVLSLFWLVYCFVTSIVNPELILCSIMAFVAVFFREQQTPNLTKYIAFILLIVVLTNSNIFEIEISPLTLLGNLFFVVVIAWSILSQHHNKWRLIKIGFFSIAFVISLVIAFYYRDAISLFVACFSVFVAFLHSPFAIKRLYHRIGLALVYLCSLLIYLYGQMVFTGPPVVSVSVKRTKTPVEHIAVTHSNNSVIASPDRELSYIEYPLGVHTTGSKKIGTTAGVMGHHLAKIVVPYPMSFYYGFDVVPILTADEPLAILAIGLHLALFLLALFLFKRHYVFSIGIFIYLVGVALYSNYFIPIPGMVADRFMFIPSLGWCIVLVYGLAYFFKVKPEEGLKNKQGVNRVFAAIVLVVLLGYSFLTYLRSLDWKDHLTLMRKDVQYVTNSAQAHNLLALNIMKSTTEGQKTQAELDALRQEALGHFKQSFAIYPKTFNVAYDIGRVYSAMNNPDSMMVYFQKAADLDPDHQLPELSYTLAVYHQETKKYDYAIIQLQKLLKLQNTNLEAYSRLSYIYFTLGQYDQALATNRTAAFNLPTRPEPFINMAYTFQGMKNLDSMTYYFNLAEQRFPGHPVVLQAKRNLNNQ